MIKFVHVTSGSAGRFSLNRCNLEIRRGEVLSIVGMTGAGKSSVLSALSGRAKIQRGQIMWEGRDLSRSPRILAARCAYANETIDGPLDLETSEWVSFWLELAGVPSHERTQRVNDACGLFKVSPSSRTMNSLSRGERRLWDLVRLLASPHDVLVMDSVSSDLDGGGLALLTAAIKDAATDGKTVILAENSPHLPVAVSDRVLVVEDGAVVSEMTRSDSVFQSRVATAQGWAD